MTCGETFADWDGVDVTASLAGRPGTGPGPAREVGAVRALARALAGDPAGAAGSLADIALGLCGAGSAGVTLPAEGGSARWAAVAGALSASEGLQLPVCRAAAAESHGLGPGSRLYQRPARGVGALIGVDPGIEELLAVPIRAGGAGLGAVWVASHGGEGGGAFSAADARALETLADVAGASLAAGHVDEALRQSEARFRTLADAMPVIVWSAGADGGNDAFNGRWYEYTGLTPGQSVGSGWLLALHPDDRPRAEARWARATATGEPYEIEYRFRSAAGEFRWFLGRALPSRAAGGRVVAWIGTCTDIDDRKKSELALEDAARRKDEFLAMLAHELRNPLAAVHNATLLLRVGADEPTRDWAVGVVERQVNLLSHLIDDLLDVSRITRGKIRLRKERIEASAVADSAVEAVRPLVDQRRHALTVALDRGGLWLDADPTRLEQVLVNLLSNAARYTEPGGSITLSARREGGHVVFRVRDTGAGIPGELLPHVFDLFSQGDRSLARTEGGLGIGLTLVKRLVDLHEGVVSATSAGPGFGSEFTVGLPASEPLPLPTAAAEPAPTPSPSAAAAEDGAGAVAKVLIVDDNVDLARGMARLLKLLGHEIRIVHDGLAALEEARDYRPEYVLLDIGLPVLDGYEVARRLRGELGLKDSVIIAITGYGQDDDRRRSMEAGFDFHLTKPVDHDTLFSLLADADIPRGH